MHPNFQDVIKPDSRDAWLLAELDIERLPRHIAVIMDGNGRWARMRGKPRIFGHRAGAESVRSIVDTFARLEIDAVTLYAFSTENWKRPEDEISGLMSMLKHYLRSELRSVHKNNIRFRAIGDLAGLAPDIQSELEKGMEFTAANTGMTLCVALNYGGREEIAQACRKAAAEVIAKGEPVSAINETLIEKHLYTAGLPPVDLLIRTSGEMRISNFLLWQLAYSEIFVTPTLFPDFRRPEIFEALLDYQQRDRRFGGLTAAG